MGDSAPGGHGGRVERVQSCGGAAFSSGTYFFFFSFFFKSFFSKRAKDTQAADNKLRYTELELCDTSQMQEGGVAGGGDQTTIETRR